MLYHLNSIITIAYRDFIKFLRDPRRVVFSFIFPILFIGVLGGSLQQNLGDSAGYNFLVFTFTGVLAQTLFQSTASGIISLITDRDNDFAQELFVSPASRYSIIMGKIIGESLVAIAQALGIIAFGFVIGVDMSFAQLLAVFPAGVAAALLGGAFGIIVMANLNDVKAANQIFPLLIFPQFFLAGVFNPIQQLSTPLLVLSRLMPMTYAVDLLRNVFYSFRPDEIAKTTLYPASVDLIVLLIFFVVFLILGTYIFVHNERNR
ncbi:ABC transporter permease [Candidatus Dojkabacteria bacterium]|uniref:Transport permease protein n=1 Tax=Candidatus Dojkabacteria bacterium TaxID=2099670 RepID=A0A955I4S3_9BACT|nr:ABC transporter permease [Candidatus Dojkabacteria bacterium]